MKKKLHKYIALNTCVLEKTVQNYFTSLIYYANLELK